MIEKNKRVKEVIPGRNRRELDSLHSSRRYQIRTPEVGGGRHSVLDTESHLEAPRLEFRDREISFVMVAERKSHQRNED